jgi:hypothetical protein
MAWTVGRFVSADPLRKPPPSASAEKATFRQVRKTNHRFLDTGQSANYTEPKCPLGEFNESGAVRCARPIDFADFATAPKTTLDWPAPPPAPQTPALGRSGSASGGTSGSGGLMPPATLGQAQQRQKLDALQELSAVRRSVLKSSVGKFVDYHFLRFVTDRKVRADSN